MAAATGGNYRRRMNENKRTIPDVVFLVMISAVLVTSIVGVVIDLVPGRSSERAGSLPVATATAGSTATSGDATTESSTSASLPGGSSRPPVTVTESTDNADGYWRFGTAGEEGLVREGVDGYVELCRRTGADAVLVARGRTIVGEWYSPRYNGSLYAMSSTKSVTGLLVGIAQDDGLLSVSDPVGDYIDSWNNGIRARVTVRNLLTQTSGLSQRSGQESVGSVANKNTFVIGLEPDTEPGRQFVYSNEGVQLLSPILEQAIGGRLDEFATERLFAPLGMDHTSLHISGSDRSVWTYADMETTPRDFARLGRLILDGGTHDGDQIVSGDYLVEAMGPSDLADNYGYLWWRFVGDAGIPGVASLGYLSTDMYVLTDDDVVIVRMKAPRTTYSGVNEERPYSQGLVATMFRVMVGLSDPAEADRVLSGVPERD